MSSKRGKGFREVGKERGQKKRKGKIIDLMSLRVGLMVV